MRPLIGIALFALLPLTGPACVVRAAPPPPRAAMGLESWNLNHPQAAGELCTWARNHPDAARRLFDWEGHHPERAQEFVTWSLTHPGRGIDAFVSEHPNWADFDFITETHRPAANAFMGWCRRHAAAAEELMTHPGGLTWAAHHGGC